MASKFALVITNTEYQDANFAKLTAPGKDAEEFAHVLREPELAGFDDVQVLLNEGESKIRRSIARFFVDRKRDDLLLLYFSGHGIRVFQASEVLFTISSSALPFLLSPCDTSFLLSIHLAHNMALSGDSQVAVQVPGRRRRVPC